MRTRDLDQRPDVEPMPSRVAVVIRMRNRAYHATAHLGLADREHRRRHQLLLGQVEVLGRLALDAEHDHVAGLQVVDRLGRGRPAVREHVVDVGDQVGPDLVAAKRPAARLVARGLGRRAAGSARRLRVAGVARRLARRGPGRGVLLALTVLHVQRPSDRAAEQEPAQRDPSDQFEYVHDVDLLFIRTMTIPNPRSPDRAWSR